MTAKGIAYIAAFCLKIFSFGKTVVIFPIVLHNKKLQNPRLVKDAARSLMIAIKHIGLAALCVGIVRKWRRIVVPKIPVDEAPAGPAMDAAVAKALGWHEEVGWWKDEGGEKQRAACIGCDGKSTWSPSEDIAAAWELVELLVQDYEFYITNYYNPDGWSANYRLKTTEWISVDADSVPLGISRAFLKANSVEHVEVPE